MRNVLMLVAALGFAGAAVAADIGQVKVSKGSVEIQRGATKMPANVGVGLPGADVVVTGADGSAGRTFTDHSLVSFGPTYVRLVDSNARRAWNTVRPKNLVFSPRDACANGAPP